MHMPEGWIIKHWRKDRCDKNTQMRWQRRDVMIAKKCMEAIFSFTGVDGGYIFN